MSNEVPDTPSMPRLRPERKWRTAQWKTLSGALTMVTALAVVWAILATVTARQRERDLEKVAVEINDLYEALRRLESAPDASPGGGLMDLEFDDAADAPEGPLDLDALLDLELNDDFFTDEE